MSEHCLIVMAKHPEAGKVKTRLAAEAGDDVALAVYRALLGINADLVAHWNGTKRVAFAGTPDPTTLALFTKAGATFTRQEGGDLGQRMHTAFASAFEAHPNTTCLMMGTDCPDLTLHHLHEATAMLAHHDVVFGPASDGGYYLIGMKNLHTALFHDVPWSTAEVLATSLTLCQHLNLRVAVLEELSDIDYLADLNASRRMSGHDFC